MQVVAETTRHFTTTVYVVNDGATVLHEHPKHGVWLPPGGHVERGELPNKAAVREVAEEVGLDVEIVSNADNVGQEHIEVLPTPEHLLLVDVNVSGDDVGHQYIDMIYYAVASNRELSPDNGEVPTENWEWFTVQELIADDRIGDSVKKIGVEAIDSV